MFSKILVILGVLASTPGYAEEAKSLDELLRLAYQNNPGVKEYQQSWSAEDSLVTSQATLDDPMIGVSELDRGLKTQYGTVSQKIRFPTKYIYQANAQRSKADSYRSQLNAKKLEVKQEVTTLYFAIYSAQKIIQLTQANMESVKEFARVAEKKYAAGKSSQGDSMKAHFELTQLELDLIRLKQEEQALQDKLKATVNSSTLENIEISNLNLPPPQFAAEKIKLIESELLNQLQASSPTLKTEVHKLKEVEYKSSLAKWEFAPDFQLQYQKRISGDPQDSSIFSVGITVPLWFWKKSSEASAASAKKLAQEYRLQDTGLKLVAQIKDLKGKVSTGAKTLKIYQTSLIPQAQGAYNSSRSAYQANKTSFLDLLDSERSLYRVKTGYYQSLKQYVATLSQLESQLGFEVSNLSAVSEVKNEK
ncbi:MAG: TolC family protein [Bdellovibrionales bacterium]|nr:TolC family protein [Bdellovibrionales bacterium]